MAETAVVGYPHEIYGEGMQIETACVHNILCFVHLYLPGIYAFVILKDNVVATVESIAEDLKNVVKKKIAAFALPNEFLVCKLLL